MVVTVNLLPDHNQLPESDGAIVENFAEHPQSILLTSAIYPILQQLHPDGQFTIGQDSGIYWQITADPLKGCIAPDWFYVPNVPPMLEGKYRRSYVLWQEKVPPLIVIEFVSGDGREERDQTPPSPGCKPGKFWVYEQGIRVPYYGIYEVSKGAVEVYHLVNDRYQRMVANARGHIFIPEMGVSLGIWQGCYCGMELPWLRWYDGEGKLLPTGEERAELERQRAELERQRAEFEYQRAEQERQQKEKLIAKLRSLGIDPDTLQT
ncbi:MAG: Uma2 family endonuclease [Pseudanabaenaceae cyanobacterium SKYGB_i_bin29]|nr:Uma2 family endonuclease [Pseudanabaenaceae cyanobacterium SKYG29]MDW8421652.1 Uma2 family endonuclease [Pseudanabaenaceae cyanobacterium SKYGB_i_bin29]